MTDYMKLGKALEIVHQLAEDERATLISNHLDPEDGNDAKELQEIQTALDTVHDFIVNNGDKPYRSVRNIDKLVQAVLDSWDMDRLMGYAVYNLIANYKRDEDSFYEDWAMMFEDEDE